MNLKKNVEDNLKLCKICSIIAILYVGVLKQ